MNTTPLLNRVPKRTLHAAAALFVAFAFAFALAACGGDDEAGNAPPPGAAVSASIGAAGGTLAGPNGSQLVVPPGALAQTTTVSIAQDSTGAPPLPAGTTAVGAMFTLTPHGTAFAAPANLSLPFDASLAPAGNMPVLMKTNAAQTGWDIVANGTVSGSAVQASISGFSWAIIVVPPVLPTLAVQPADQAVVEPAAATFTVGATGPTLSGVLSFQWRRNGAVIAGATQASYSTGPSSITTDDGALYSVAVSNRAGTVTSTSARLTVTAAIVAPAITQQPADTSVVVGSGASFSVVATGTALQFQWERSAAAGQPFVAVNGANGASFTLAVAAAADSGARFQVRVSNAAGSITSNAATLTVTAVPPPASALGRISAGSRFSLAVNAAGVPYSWGNDSASQLGNGLPDANRNTAAPFGTITDIRSLSAGQEYHGIVVRNDGTAWAWGYRGNVDCAVGTVASAPFKVDYATDILAASAGYDHTLLLRNDGRVLSFGCNNAGQLGRPGAAPPMTPPAVVSGLAANIVAVAAGDGYSLALDANGDVWSWGRANPTDRSGRSDSPTPVRLAGLSNIIAIAAANEHALALRRDGAVLAWGSNRNGKLGDGTEVDRAVPTLTLLASQITAIAAGSNNSLALRADGIVLSWGINETGQLGSGSASPGFRPAPAPVVGLADVVAISCGFGLGHSLALRRDGSVWAWGRNDAGQLGDGSNTTRLAPVVVQGLNLN